MRFRDLFWKEPPWRREKALRGGPEVLESIQQGNQFMPLIGVGPAPFGGTNKRVAAAFQETISAQYAYIYASQPSVRTVVDFIARNIAQLALRLYERVGDNERRQRSDHDAAVALRRPNPNTPGEQFIFNVVADWLVHNNAYIVKFRPTPKQLVLYTLPAHRVGVLGEDFFAATGYRLYRMDGSFLDVNPDAVIHWRGYNPTDPRLGISPLETLRKTLAEDSALQTANVELAKLGWAPPGYIRRPLEAPPWTPEAAERFKEEWANQQKDSSRHTPILEEGMEFNDFGFSPKDAQVLDGRRFTLETVAALYGMPLGVLGLGKGATEQEQREFYQDVLPPICEMFCAYLDMGLLQQEFALDDYYLEFDLDEKLQGDSRIATLVSAAGVPILTRNEARAKLNQPPVEQGDEIVTPLNVLIGKVPKPSPNTMPIQDPNKPAQDGSHRTAEPSKNGSKKNGSSQDKDFEAREKALLKLVRRRSEKQVRRNGYASELSEVLRRFYNRQEKAIRGRQSRKDAKAKTFDMPRWVRELAKDLLAVMTVVVGREANLAMARFGASKDFDLDQVEHWLGEVAEGIATDINRTTREALDSGGDAAEVFEEARTRRAEVGGSDLATKLANFAEIEAAKLAPDPEMRLKTWCVMSDNSLHPEMDGERVPISEPFSNGVMAPPYEHIGCQCLIDIE